MSFLYPEKFTKKPINKIRTNQAKVPIFLVREVRLKPNGAVIATFRMRNLNELSNADMSVWSQTKQ